MNILENYEVSLKGVSPLIMNAVTLCDPLHPMKKKLSEICALRNAKKQ